MRMCVQVMKKSVQENVKYSFCVTEEFVVTPQPEVASARASLGHRSVVSEEEIHGREAELISEEVKANTGNVELSLPSREKVLHEYFHFDFA